MPPRKASGSKAAPPAPTPLQGVEDALSRLNATLASYRPKSERTEAGPPGPPEPNDSENDTLSRGGLSSSNPKTRKKARKAVEAEFCKEMFYTRLKKPNHKDLYPKVTNIELRKRLNRLHELLGWQDYWPYSIELQVEIAQAYTELGYPDLACGAAYKAMLLLDAVKDESDEYHEDAYNTVRETIESQPVRLRFVHGRGDARVAHRLDPENMEYDKDGFIMPKPDDDEIMLWVEDRYTPIVFGYLIQCLFACGCWQSAYKYSNLACKFMPEDEVMSNMRDVIVQAVELQHEPDRLISEPFELPLEDWPDQGVVRRECYPWAEGVLDRDRFTEESLTALNHEMAKVAPKLEVRAVELPKLSTDGSTESSTSKQLGVFAKEDIAPGEIILEEPTLLTANNRLQDALCDACNADLPRPGEEGASDVTACPECEIIFCSEQCLEDAQHNYHPAVCDKDLDSVARDVKPARAADSLYILLLLRSLALAETRDEFVLSMPEVRFIWGDYHTADTNALFKPQQKGQTINDGKPGTPESLNPLHNNFPRTLPFSFEANVVLPFQFLTKMDVDIFDNYDRYDVWIFNMLYAKFRGTASARLSGLGGRPVRGPEVSAVHANWCLANHSCDPNVQWEWGGKVRFWAREERPVWKRDGEEWAKNKAGIKKGEEILNHYCDVDLGVKARREWASGALGGDCRCERCIWEAGEREVKV